MSQSKELKEFYYKVALRGPVFTQSGYGEYARSLYRILNQIDEFDITLQATPWGLTPFIMDRNHPDFPLLESGIKNTQIELQQQIKYDVSFQVQLPDEWDPNVAKFNVGVTAATEVDRVSGEWQAACNRMNLVIAMSEHTKRTLLSGPIPITTPIIVVGSAVHPHSLDQSSDSEFEIEFDDDVKDVLLHVGQISGDPTRDRKNTYGLVRAFKEAFKDDPTKALVLKVNLGRNTAIDRNNSAITLKNYVNAVVPNSKARVYLLHGQMTTKQMGYLYRHPKVRAFVSFTRGEGFGLPFLEAAVNGLPIIATNHSSYTEFLYKDGDSMFARVPFEMKEVPQQYVEGRIIPKGSKWAEVSHDIAVKSLVKFFEKGPTQFKRKAESLKEDVINRFSLLKMTDDLKNELSTIFPDTF